MDFSGSFPTASGGLGLGRFWLLTTAARYSSAIFGTSSSFLPASANACADLPRPYTLVSGAPPTANVYGVGIPA